MGKSKVLVTGAAGYVGSRLVPALLQNDLEVVAFDTFWYGSTLPTHHPLLSCVQGDLRFFDFKSILPGITAVIHLACISNDPSFELDPKFSEQVNVFGSQRLIDDCLKFPIERFIYASSSSVYGIKEEAIVHEDLSLQPLTCYSQNKVDIENYLKKCVKNKFDYVVLRPATLMGSSPRLRLDVVTHILTSQGYFEKKIRVHGGNQFRPQLHIDDMVRAYLLCVKAEKDFSGEIFNVGQDNYTVSEIAETVSQVLSDKITIDYQTITDARSYRVSSEKIKTQRGFVPQKNLKDGISDLIQHFKMNPNLIWTDDQFHNVKRLKNLLGQSFVEAFVE